MLTSIISAIIILGSLVLIHEAGHFLVAKRCGVRVLRFSIGYPPKLFGIRRGETEYVIGGTPFGGYVRMLGDEIGDELGPSDVQTFLTEVSRDLTTAADQAAENDAEVRKLLETGREQAGQLVQVTGGETGPDALFALTQALRLSP